MFTGAPLESVARFLRFLFGVAKQLLVRTHSVDVMRLSHMPLEQWIAEGNDFLKWMTAKKVKE